VKIKVIDGKPQVSYPCHWQYKVIGLKEEAVKQAIREIVSDSDHLISPSKKSSSGKYHSFNLEIFVTSEESRNFFFNELRAHSAVTMVI
jgi:putative lipoic acid-binding regulatory protein